jgi:hypothetical protein
MGLQLLKQKQLLPYNTHVHLLLADVHLKKRGLGLLEFDSCGGQLKGILKAKIDLFRQPAGCF